MGFPTDTLIRLLLLSIPNARSEADSLAQLCRRLSRLGGLGPTCGNIDPGFYWNLFPIYEAERRSYVDFPYEE